MDVILFTSPWIANKERRLKFWTLWFEGFRHMVFDLIPRLLILRKIEVCLAQSISNLLSYTHSCIAPHWQVQSDSIYSNTPQRDLYVLISVWLVSLIQLKSYKLWMMLLLQNCYRNVYMSGYHNIPILEQADHLIRSSTKVEQPFQRHCDNNYYQCLNLLFSSDRPLTMNLSDKILASYKMLIFIPLGILPLLAQSLNIVVINSIIDRSVIVLTITDLT